VIILEAILGGCAAIAAIAGLISGLAKWKKTRWFAWLFERVAVQPMEEMLTRRIDEQLVPMASKVDRIYYEMHPNGGSALRDVVDRTERKVDRTVKTLDEQGERLARVEGQVDVLTHRQRQD
jgi:predicted YcjX-like family ATPase